jgi:hypothetical protein
MRRYKRSTGISTLLVAVILIFTASPAVQSLERKGNLTLYVLIDRSLSMEEEIEEVKGYVQQSIVEEILIPGDSVIFVEFFRVPRVALSMTISSQEDKERIKAELGRIQADKAYTDIGSALDFLEEDSAQRRMPEFRSQTLLFSDLIHEAPKGSPYAGTNRDFSHPLLSPRKEVRHNGWKLFILGPGVEERAGRIAREVVSVRPEAD